MGKSKYPIDLTEEERAELEDIVSVGENSAQKITRARILLRADEGWTDTDIADALDCSRDTAQCTRKKYHTRDGIEAVERKSPDRTYERTLDGRDEAHLIRLVCSEAPDGHARWTLRLLADEVVASQEIDVDSISHETIRQILKKTNCSLTNPNNG